MNRLCPVNSWCGSVWSVSCGIPKEPSRYQSRPHTHNQSLKLTHTVDAYTVSGQFKSSTQTHVFPDTFHSVVLLDESFCTTFRVCNDGSIQMFELAVFKTWLTCYEYIKDRSKKILVLLSFDLLYFVKLAQLTHWLMSYEMAHEKSLFLSFYVFLSTIK